MLALLGTRPCARGWVLAAGEARRLDPGPPFVARVWGMVPTSTGRRARCEVLVGAGGAVGRVEAAGRSLLSETESQEAARRSGHAWQAALASERTVATVATLNAATLKKSREV